MSAGELLAVNVGMPKDVSWEGRTVHTGIWKSAIEGRRAVSRLNVDGDGQGDTAGHGGVNRAVFVYQTGSYRYWERELGRDDFVYGQFGENFTVSGLDDDEVCVGDRYRIGSALFEVSQPRVTCYRVGIRMDEPRMPSLLVAHHRPGFYFRVLEEGEIGAGDSVELVARGDEAMSVADVDALLYLPGHSRRDLERALRIPALSAGWQGSFREMLDEPPVEAPAWAGMRSMRVVAIERESGSVISVRLVPADGEGATPALPGQFLTVRVNALLRTYSLSGLPDDESYRISVKREPHGVASGYLHGSLRVGDVLEAGAPRGSFVLRDGSRPVVLVSAGVGATPVLAMLHVLVSSGSSREVWWLHGARNRAEHPFAQEARELLSQLPGARSVVAYSAPGPDDSGYDVSGRLSGEVVSSFGVPVDADFYLCGPGAFMRDMAGALTALGVSPERVRTEPFGPEDAINPGVIDGAVVAPHPPEGVAGGGPVVSFSRSNLSVEWDPSFSSLLELAEACDVPVRWSCRTGVCHTCETGLVAGDVDYRPDPLEPAVPGTALICCSRPRGEVALDL